MPTWDFEQLEEAKQVISGLIGALTVSPVDGRIHTELYTTAERRFVAEHPEAKGYRTTGCMPEQAVEKYYEQLDYCATCPGVERCKFGGVLNVADIDHEWHMIAWRTKRCNPAFRSDTQRLMEQKQKAAGIPRRYWRTTIADFDSKGNAVALSAVRSFVAERQSVILFGGRGCGKTMLASIMANAAIKSKETVVFFSVADMNTTLKTAITKGDLEAVVQRLINADVLVLDDIGAESATAWTMEQLFVIVNGRYNNGDGRLIITSNERPASLRSAWARINDVGERIFSRLSELCIFAEVNGDDHRLKTI